MAHGPESEGGAGSEDYDRRATGKAKSKGKSPQVDGDNPDVVDNHDVFYLAPGEEPVTQYSTMKFPPYEYRAFPKWVKHPRDSKVTKLVNNQSEELQFLGTSLEGEPPEPSPLEKENLDLAQQIAKLQEENARLTRETQNRAIQPNPKKGN